MTKGIRMVVSYRYPSDRQCLARQKIKKRQLSTIVPSPIDSSSLIRIDRASSITFTYSDAYMPVYFLSRTHLSFLAASQISDIPLYSHDHSMSFFSRATPKDNLI